MSGNFIDFAELKSSVSISQVVEWLGLDLKPQSNGQLRGCCPIHGGKNEREFVVTPGKGLFFCFGPCGGGDCIKLTAHFLKIGTKEAAQQIAKHFGVGNSKVPVPSRTVPPSITNQPPETAQQGRQDALKPLDHLTTDHPAIEALGLSEAICTALGIGYASKGLMKGRVVFPLRLMDGTLVGYQGLATSGDQAPLLLFPKNLAEKVAAAPQEQSKQHPDDLRKLFRVVA